jgi:hypothetical protein
VLLSSTSFRIPPTRLRRPQNQLYCLKKDRNNDNLNRLKDHVKISTVISHYLPLDTKTSPEYSSSSSARNLKGITLCPFHEDTKPSMHFSDQKQVFKCFACGAGGDIYKFVGKVRASCGRMRLVSTMKLS